MVKAGGVKAATPFDDKLMRRVIILERGNRHFEVTRVGKAVRANRAAVRQGEFGPVILANIAAHHLRIGTDLGHHAPRQHGNMPGWHNHPAHFGKNVQLAAFRDKGFPVLYPHVAPKNAATDGGRLAQKIPSIMGIDEKGYDFVEEVAPVAGDVLLPKKHPSAFFGTPLTSHLIDLGVDTLVVTGCTTSGCVRASVTDAFALNFKVIVPEDCVYDRAPTSHAVNLWDMNGKYADVMPSDEVAATLQGLEAAI